MDSKIETNSSSAPDYEISSDSAASGRVITDDEFVIRKFLAVAMNYGTTDSSQPTNEHPKRLDFRKLLEDEATLFTGAQKTRKRSSSILLKNVNKEDRQGTPTFNRKSPRLLKMNADIVTDEDGDDVLESYSVALSTKTELSASLDGLSSVSDISQDDSLLSKRSSKKTFRRSKSWRGSRRFRRSSISIDEADSAAESSSVLDPSKSDLEGEHSITMSDVRKILDSEEVSESVPGKKTKKIRGKKKWRNSLRGSLKNLRKTDEQSEEFISQEDVRDTSESASYDAPKLPMGDKRKPTTFRSPRKERVQTRRRRGSILLSPRTLPEVEESKQRRRALAASRVLHTLDRDATCDLILAMLVINPINDGPDDYHIETFSELKNADDELSVESFLKKDEVRRRLVRVGNGRGFVQQDDFDETQGLSILFCLEHMRLRVTPKSKQKFLSINKHKFVAWLQACLGRAVQFDSGIIETLFIRVKHIQQALSGKRLPILLDLMDDEQRGRYEKAFEMSGALRRYRKLGGDKETLGVTKLPSKLKRKSNVDLTTEAESTDRKAPTTVGQMLADLEAIDAQWQQIPDVQRALSEKKYEPFLQLKSSQVKQAVINGMLTAKRKKQAAVQRSMDYCLTSIVFDPQTLMLKLWQASTETLRKFIKVNGASLTKLDLSGCPGVDNSLFDALDPIRRQLVSLTLANTAVTAIHKDLPNLWYLDLSGNKHISDRIFKDIKEHCFSLMTLLLRNTPISSIETTLLIRSLDLSGCTRITDGIFEDVKRNLQKLSVLILQNIKVQEVNTAELNLSQLDVSKCAGLVKIYTEAKSSGGAKHKRGMKILTANQCNHLADITLKEINLVGLYANNNKRLTNVTLSAGRVLPNFKILEVDNDKALTVLDVNPMQLVVFRALNVVQVNTALSDELCRRLLDEVCATQTMTESSRRSPGAMTALLRAKFDLVKWAVGERGKSVFANVKVRGFDGTFGNVEGIDAYQSDFRDARWYGINARNASLIDVKLGGAIFGQLPMWKDQDGACVTCIAKSPDGKMIATSDNRGKVVLRSGEEVLHVFEFGCSVNAVRFDPSGNSLLVVGDLKAPEQESQKQETWHRITLEMVGEREKLMAVNTKLESLRAELSKSKDAKSTESINRLTNEIKTEEAQVELIQQKIRTLEDEDNSAREQRSAQVLQQAEETEVAYTLSVWDLGRYELKRFDKLPSWFRSHCNPILSMAMSVDGRYVATVSDDDIGVKVRDFTTGDVHFSAHHNAVEFHPNCKWMATATFDNKVVIWDIADKKPLKTLDDVEGIVDTLLFSPNGKLLIASCSDKHIYIWDVATWQCARKLADGQHAPNCLAISPDSKLLASGDQYGIGGESCAIVWDLTSGDIVQKIGHPYSISSLAFLPYQKKTTSKRKGKDEQRWLLLSTCGDGLIRRSIIRNDGAKYQLQRKMKTQLIAKDAELHDTTGLTTGQFTLLQQLGACGEPNSLITTSATGQKKRLKGKKRVRRRKPQTQDRTTTEDQPSKDPGNSNLSMN